MAALRRLFLVGAATVLIQEPFASCEEASTILETVVVNCLDDFNEARKAAGLEDLVLSKEAWPFENFSLSSNHPKRSGQGVAEMLCLDVHSAFKVDREGHRVVVTSKNKYEEILSKIEALQLDDDESSTWLYFQMHEPADCKAAVEAWKDAGKSFEDLPPQYDSRFHSPYLKSKNRSFVGLFNPTVKATMRCLHITCKLPYYENPIDAEGMLCVTEPPALKKGKPPFTPEQWKNIRSSITSGSQSSTPISTTSATVFILGFSVLSIFSYL